jgi:signal transduction histidine kinase
LEAMTGALVGLGRESEPEKFLEHVLRFTCSQLGAHSISFWTLSNQAGCVELQAVFEEDRLYEHPQDSGSAPPQMMLEISTHPVWSPFFQTGEHCVYGRVSSNPPHSRIALDFNGPWYDWQAPVVAHPGTSGMIRRIATLGVTATLCIPMIVSSKVTGMFSIRFLKERTLRREEIELARAMTQQAMLAIQLMRLTKQSRESAVTAERNRMARDLHDTLAQGFTGVIMQLEAAKGASANADPAAVSAHIERAEQLARTSLAEARRSVRAMRSRSLVDGSLSTALDELLKRMTSATGLQADLVVQGECRSLPPDWEEGLLRIAQESLTNTLKYAEARRFRATLSFHTNAVRLQLVDDGRGFDTRAEHEGFGLIGMRERAEQMAGQFVLRSKAGEGTEILIELTQSHAADGNDEKQQAG